MQEDVAEGEKESGNIADQEEVEQPVDESAATNGKRLIFCDKVFVLLLKNTFKIYFVLYAVIQNLMHD